ncbi:MAG: ferredoxin [Fimbriimonadales bacterium]|nr:ferredoxin [Fimbriimonadales bacterium]
MRRDALGALSPVEGSFLCGNIEDSEMNRREKVLDSLRIVIDRDRCIGTANCVSVAPQFFELDEESLCSFKEPADEVSPDVVVEACRVCPVDALSVFRLSGERLVPESGEE